MKKDEIKYVYTVSLGCPKNLVDTEVIAASLLKNGFGFTQDYEQADIFLLSTCAFIGPALEESEELIETAIQWKGEEPNKRSIVVCGCMLERKPLNELQLAYPDVDFWMGIDFIENAGEYLIKLFKGTKETNDSKKAIVSDSKAVYLYNDNTPRLQLTLPHTAYVKISDGCSNCCSYCTIPQIRGDLRSREPESVLREIENLLGNGVREIILIGQDTTSFGAERGFCDGISSLVKQIDNIGGDFWLRLMYAHPASFPLSLVDLFGSSDHLLPYVDLPIQHISDNILNLMNRRCDSSHIKNLLKRLKIEVPDIGIRTTLITGLPGEGEKEFKELCDFISEEKFSRLGVFPYYPEPGTPAFEMDDRVSFEESTERSEKILDIQSEISLKANKRLEGKQIDVIFDMYLEENYGTGRSKKDAPEIDNEVKFSNFSESEPGDILKVRINKSSEYELEGENVITE